MARDNNPQGGRRREVEIAVNRGLSKRFPHQAAVRVRLRGDVEADYDVVQKEIPESLQNATYNGKPVRWINNFGVRRKGRDQFEQRVSAYELSLEKVEGAEYVYFDGQNIRGLGVAPDDEDAARVKATLDLGDPPVGWT
jgi:hypothetical protein